MVSEPGLPFEETLDQQIACVLAQVEYSRKALTWTLKRRDEVDKEVKRIASEILAGKRRLYELNWKG